jgi:activator of HSP90 ATPase
MDQKDAKRTMGMPASNVSGSSPLVFNRRQVIAISTLSIVGAAARAAPPPDETDTEISKSEEAIHQVRVFAAKRTRIYAALTDELQFDKIVHLSGVATTSPTKLSARVGGTFTLFGGHIVGTQLDLVPDELIVQAWRVVDWPLGSYSIARYDLGDQGASTRLVFDHTGFPKGLAGHLASGWQEHYWDPLSKLLS